MEKKEQEVAEEYLSSLADLNLNSKPLINMLTILAEENIEYAAVIVKAVEQHIAKVSAEVKLPVLYLIDSIVKNVGRDYISLFSHCIVTVFCGVFEKVNEKIREKMYTLRQTWNDVFTPQKLYTLDVKVNCMDPNWPITAKVLPKSPAIHVNPIFLNKGEPINDMQAKLRDKQRQLLELQKRKLELELAATKQRLEEQEKQLSMQTESVKSGQNIGIVSPSSGSPKLNATGKIGLQRIAHNNNATMNASIGNSNVNKTRVAPVSSAILNSIKQRDPRLIRQQQPENSGNVTTIATTDNRGLSTLLSSLPKEQKSQDGSEKLLTKYPHIKQGSSTKEKQRTSSNTTGGSKKPHSKGIVQKGVSNNESKYSSRSSSSRAKGNRMGSSKTTIINASNGSRIIERDIRTKQSVEKRKSAKSDVNRKVHEETTAKLSEKSPRKQQEKQSDEVDINLELKFKELKESTKNRNYIRRNREKSTSPNNRMQEDSDIRMLLPEKKIKMDDITKGQESSIRSESSVVLAASANTSDKLVQNLDQNIEAASCMDIDLRQFQTNISQSSSLQQTNDAAAGGVMTAIGSDMITTKKRLSAECNEEPASKKTRSEELDPLFGSEDVDLRKLNTLSNVTSTNNAMIMTPPPPPIISQENESWAMLKGQHGNILSPKSNLDDVRAKLAKASKTYRKKTESRFHELQKSGFTETNEDSEDGTDAKIRTIISQAQELLDTENMNAKQYKELVKTVIQISETNKLKEAQRRESMLFKSNNLEDLTPISDDEVKFSSEDETENEIPKPMRLRRLTKALKIDNNESDSEISNRQSPTMGTTIQYTDNNRSKGNEKRNRNREAKWASQFEAIANNTRAQKNWLHNNTRPLFAQKLGSHNPPQVPSNIPNRINVPSPWQNPPPMIFPSSVPIAHMNPVGPETIRPPVILSQQLSNSVDNPNSDVLRTVTIDKMQKEIRFYDEVPIAFMEWDQPKQIGFQNGQRRVTIDDRDSIILNFNDDYKIINIDGKTHKIRFGCPTRELFIDNDWYECYFGDPPVGIFLDGCVKIFKIEGPPPQLFIGSLRQDLVVGKINLIIDARIIIPVFLDAKTQTFEIDGMKHSLQFADYLKTVLIDNEPMSVEYGGLPKSILLNGVKHFIRFGTLPNGIIPGKVSIKDMVRTEFVENIDSPKFSPIDESCGSSHILPVQMNDITCVSNFSQLMHNPIEKTKNNIRENDGQPSAVTNNVNIDELFQKLLASGILNQDAKMNKSSEDSNTKTAKEKDVVKAVDLSKPETIKIRQTGIVQKLFFGMQCSSCGVRFPPEQTMKYSQHLDWHFRQNRRERDSARKAHSRKWYYDVSDWIQYEEIEDLDEREKNWFETQQNELENFDESSNPRACSPPPSCAAGPEDVDKACDMCHDKFEQFYDEESEEWHLRSAIRIDDKIYHPVCYEDYKASLKFEETATEVALDDNALDIIVKQEKEENKEEGVKENEDDDDVIVVPNEEPSITEIPDDDDEESNHQQKEKEEEKQPENTDTNPCNTNFKNNDSLESDVEIQEPNIPFTDLDSYEEVHGESVLTLDDSSQSSHINQVKIKEEPKYDGYDDDAFEDVGTFVYVDDISQNNDEYVAHSVTSAPHESIKPCIDGNMDLHEAGTSSVVGVNKIKINITKAVSGNNQKSNVHSSENTSNVSVLVNEESTNDTSANNIVESKSDAKMSDSVGPNKEENNTEMVEINDFSNSEIIFKPEMQGIEFEGMPVCKSGFETSGLCSIM